MIIASDPAVANIAAGSRLNYKYRCPRDYYFDYLIIFVSMLAIKAHLIIIFMCRRYSRSNGP